MRLVNVRGRLAVEVDGQRFDVEKASEGLFSSDPQAVYPRWAEFRTWARSASLRDTAPLGPLERGDLGSPAPSPPQIFAIGLNYSAHAAESGFAKPSDPVVFTKFVSSLAGPSGTIVLPRGSVDWEVELVVVMGRGGRDIPEAEAWSAVAGLTVGQDISERELQHRGPAPQFSLAKSHAGFSPVGPALVTLDELADPDDLALGCAINGEVVQQGRTRDLIFPVPELIARLSRTIELLPGDLIFTGTPAGVGAGRVPPRFLQDGDVLRSWIDGLGETEHTFVAAHAPVPA